MKKTEKIIALVLIILGISVICGYLFIDSATTEVRAVSVYPKRVECVVVSTGTITAKNSETVTYDSTVYPKEIKVSVGDVIEEDDVVMIALNSRLKEVKIRSDYSGIVTALPVSVGKEAKSGMALAVVSKTDQLKIKSRISETESDAVEIGQSVEIKCNGFGDRVYNGTVSRKSAIAEQSSDGSMSVDVTVDIDNPDEHLLLGMSTKVYINTRAEIDVVAVPYTAIEYYGEDAYVYVTDGKDTKKQSVEIGIEGEKLAQITGGIDKSARVVENKNLLKKGKRVKIIIDD